MDVMVSEKCQRDQQRTRLRSEPCPYWLSFRSDDGPRGLCVACREMRAQLPRPPAKPCGGLGRLDGELGLKRIQMPSALNPLGSLEPSGLPIWQQSQAIPK